MDTIISLVRHGETEWNALGKFQGCIDISLSKEGIRQAHLLKNRFTDKYDYIYTSPLTRAVQTAEIICENNNIKPLVVHDLREISFGCWEGLTLDEIKNNYPKQFNNWITDEVSGPIIGGDMSVKNASIRAQKAIIEIAKEHKSENIIIVSHGGLIKAGLIGIFGWKMTMYHQLLLGNTSVCKISFDNDLNPKIITLNDTSHLAS